MNPTIVQDRIQAITTKFAEEVLGLFQQALIRRVEDYQKVLQKQKEDPDVGTRNPITQTAILTTDPANRCRFLLALPSGKVWTSTRARDLRRQARLKDIPVEDRT